MLCLAAGACGPGSEPDPAPAATAPARLAVLDPALGGVVAELGAGPAVVGADPLSRLQPQLAAAAGLGEPCRQGVEGVAALQPDLVLLLGDACGSALEARLASAGLRTLLLAPRSLNEVVEAYHRIGAVLAREHEAQRAVSQLVAEVGRIAVSRDGRERHRVVWIVASDPLTVVGAQGMLHEILELAGAENAFHERGADLISVTPEEIRARQPERVLDSSESPPPAGSTLRGERIAPELSRVPALDVLERVQRLHAHLYPNG